MTESLEQALDWVHAWQQSRRIPGVALVVTDRDDTLLLDVTGLADRAGMRPATTDQRWQLGSISKAFTSIAVLQLEAEGALTVGDRVADHLPWLSPQLHPEITLHHLMTHTAGLPLGSEWSPDSLLESAVQGTVGRPQPPGGRYHYSNPGYELLGDVVEHVTGAALEHRLERQVLHPIGMAGAVASVTVDDRDRDVRGHRTPRDDALWEGRSEQVPDAFFPTCTADGAVAATPDDVAHYLRFLLSGGADGVLDRDGFSRLAGRHVDTGDGWYGYGLHTRETAGRITLGHSGGMVGMFADVRVDPATGLGVGMMINGMGDVSGASSYLLNTLCGVESEPPPWPWASPEEDDRTGATDGLTAFTGLYRSYNPWVPAVRVIRSGPGLLLVDPVEGVASSLHRDGEHAFRVEHPDSPDVAEFDVLVDGRFQRLDLSGCVYARTRRP